MTEIPHYTIGRIDAPLRQLRDVARPKPGAGMSGLLNLVA